MKNFLKKLLLWVAIIIIITITFILFWKIILPKIGGLFGNTDYQAVFLSNDQVYFGRLSKMNSNFVYLKDVFYIQTNPQGGNPVLVELGTTETYGPQNHLWINRQNVRMVQDLKPDSQVIKAIKDYRASK